MRFSSMSARVQGFAAVLALSVFVGVVAAPTTAPALMPGWNIFAGWATESDGFVLGGGAHFALGPIEANPYAELIFIDGGSMYTLNGDAHLTVLPLVAANIWVGGGLGLILVDPEDGDSETDVGLNVVAGATLTKVRMNPFAKIKWVIMDSNDPVVITFGIRF